MTSEVMRDGVDNLLATCYILNRVSTNKESTVKMEAGTANLETMDLPERDFDQERVLALTFDLSPSQASVVSCLLNVFVVPPLHLMEYVGAKSNIKVPVSRARAKLREHGFDIKSRMEVGYYLEPEDKRGIEKMLADYLER